MNRTLSRSIYRLILRSHPTYFRVRFGSEMLWIFEEESQRGASVRLLFDGILSLLRQRLATQDKLIHGPMSSALLISDLRLSIVRVLQGGLIASLLFAGFMSLLERNGPFPVPLELQAQQCIPCASHPEAPEIETLRTLLH